MARAPELRVVVEVGPAEAVATLVSGLSKLVDRNRDGDIEDVTLAVDALLTEFGKVAVVESKTEPRTWSLPPEPGPKVIQVRDVDGWIWSRQTDEPGFPWVTAYPGSDGPHPEYEPWATLVAKCGPLTNATRES